MLATVQVKQRENWPPTISSLIDIERTTEIVSNRTHLDGELELKTPLSGFPKGVSKWVIPIDMSLFTALIITQVAPKTHVARHSHDGAVFRFIASGSLCLNGVDYGSGDWILVPAGVEYEIDTEEGYVAATTYHPCRGCRP
jgi:hypothetical protein